MGIQQMMLRTGYPPLTAVIPAYTSGSVDITPGTATSGIATATGSGGTGSYTYNWVKVSGAGADFLLNYPQSSQTMSWSYFFSSNGSVTQVWKCEVSDGVSTVDSNTITVELIGGPI